MWQFRSFAIACFLGVSAIVVGGGAGCSMLSNADTDEGGSGIIANVDRINAPDRISTSDTMSVQLQGTVGPNGCYSFDGFEVDRSEHHLTITPTVTQVTGDDTMCTMAIVPLEETYSAAPPFEEGTLTIEVPQTEGESVTTTVDVTNASESP